MPILNQIRMGDFGRLGLAEEWTLVALGFLKLFKV
jgi:hypothetical protein